MNTLLSMNTSIIRYEHDRFIFEILYAKFLKEMLFNKKKFECEIVALMVDCSALLLNQLPPKNERSR
jgi:hypothetical protein